MILAQHIGTSAATQSFLIAFKNRFAHGCRTERDLSLALSYVSAGRESHQIQDVRQPAGFIEVIDAPDQASFGIAPRAEIFQVQVADRKHAWRAAKLGT